MLYLIVDRLNSVFNQTAGIMLTTDEMEQLLNQLDKDGDGEINFRYD